MMARLSIEHPQLNLDISVDVERKDIVGEHFDAGIRPRGDIGQDLIAVSIGGQFWLSTVASSDYLARHTFNG
jgi:DNA-binding transcriptional LysR family regulator